GAPRSARLLVRRLLENGANSSFVSIAADPSVPVSTILKRPQDWIADASHARHPGIPLPRDLYGAARKNSAGVEFGDRQSLDALLAGVRAAAPKDARAVSLIDGRAREGRQRPVLSPIDGKAVGQVSEADDAIGREALIAAANGLAAWAARPVAERAAVLESAADLFEQNRDALITLLQHEGGKTLDDALAEVRETVDYCRYYGSQARVTFVERMPGPTGETNELHHRGRGVFVAISPWNFPLAIFTGQVAAALVAGNSVVAKPAEQTPLIAAHAVRILHHAGIPKTAVHLMPGAG